MPKNLIKLPQKYNKADPSWFGFIINVKPESHKHSYNANSVINKESTDAMLSKMKIKTKDIITESLKTNTKVSEVDMLDEKNILNSDI